MHTSKQQKPPAPGQIRIIGGQWRGRKLPVLHHPGLRPTTDRIRETLFNWLAPVLAGSRCLDCFAGSGALGFEALSRYAVEVVFLEAERTVAQQLDAHLLRLQATAGKVFHTDALNWLSQAGSPFDVVFLDPPFHQQLLANSVRLLDENNWLAQESWIYIETEVNAVLPELPSSWHLHRQKIAGQVAYRLYHRQQ